MIRYTLVQFWRQFLVPGEPTVVMSLSAEQGYELTNDGSPMLTIAKGDFVGQHPVSNVSFALVDRSTMGPSPGDREWREAFGRSVDDKPFVKAAEILKPTIDQKFESARPAKK